MFTNFESQCLYFTIWIILGFLMIQYLCKNENKKEEFDETLSQKKYAHQRVSQTDVSLQQKDFKNAYKESQKMAQIYKDTIEDDLLPLDQKSQEWADANPKGAGSLELKNMLEAGIHIGVNTQGSSLRNANQQLRSEPPNPIIPVSIFQNSSITPDIYRKPLEIG